MGAQEKSQANTNSMQRVKVYCLNDDGKWDDQGTGHAAVDYLEHPEELGLFVYDEEENETMLLHHISSDDIYRKQEDTIISWRDPEYATELALSFQETTGCSYIWDHICNVQRNMHFNTLNSEPFHSVNSELRGLPAIELSTLPLIIKTVVDSGIADHLRLTELILNDQEFFPKLVEVFRVCEDLQNMDGLHMIFEIVKGIILLNSTPIFERIFSDDFIVDIIGALEYDSEAPCVQNHRKFLKEHVVFKEAIPIKDPLVLSKIHQTYRVGFLKDVVLARLLDEATGANLNKMIHANNAVVVSLLKDDSAFIQELFARLRLPTTSLESKKNLVSFLHEFCSLSKSLSTVQQLRLFRDLMNEGIFDVVSDVLQYQDKKLVLTGADILMLFSSQDPNLLRSYVVRQEGIVLLGLLVKGMITDFEENMHCQFLEILRSLLDSCTLSGPQRDAIIDIFFEKHLGQLINVITNSCPSENITDANCKSVCVGRSVQRPGGTKSEILSNICELLCFCVLHHPYRIKCNFLLNNVIEKVLLLTHRRERYLVVTAVRFVRTILAHHDEHVINYFVQNNVLKPIVDVFVADGSHYNLLNSAVLELFEFLRKESLKPLLIYIVDSFWDQLVKFEYLISIQSLKIKYEQCLDNGGIKGAAAIVDPRRRIDERALEKEEEHYFNEDSDEEGIASASSRPNEKRPQQPISNGVAASYSNSSPWSCELVDYDDDEDYRPSPKKLPESSEKGTMESLRQKRKLPSKDKMPKLVKKHKLSKNSKSKDSVFSALCSTLSQALVPGKKITTNSHTAVQTVEGKMSSSEDNQDERPNISRSCSDNNSNKVAEGNHVEKETAASRSCSDCLCGTSDNIPMSGEDRQLVPSNSSPEMAVNGS
ncbi:PREDICTED: serine/threonine-protein phosphatase 4 regulatory subunit 3-like isoform X2 [Lupinus angustifolius]|uniref:serine/threonine-protein phosphatase 4 regulatory subunit 3-like isoform X2 n=1 Tax=Lupinus angustifolius TaxID=3871 RepID=UPI00092F4765|nr:PREDICTED: serine/threonine-protein phosphatase 4 regulatory subunit 3-like isoform X2 [Lupinus angustifolius]